MRAAKMIQPIHEERSGGYSTSSYAGDAGVLVGFSDMWSLPPDAGVGTTVPSVMGEDLVRNG